MSSPVSSPKMSITASLGKPPKIAPPSSLAGSSSSLGSSSLSTIKSATGSQSSRGVKRKASHESAPLPSQLQSIHQRLSQYRADLQEINPKSESFMQLGIERNLALMNGYNCLAFFIRDSLLKVSKMEEIKDSEISDKVEAAKKRLMQLREPVTDTQKSFAGFSALREFEVHYEKLNNEKKQLASLLSQIQDSTTGCLNWNTKEDQIERAYPQVKEIIKQIEQLHGALKTYLSKPLDPGLTVIYQNECRRLEGEVRYHIDYYYRLIFLQKHLRDLQCVRLLKAQYEQAKDEVSKITDTTTPEARAKLLQLKNFTIEFLSHAFALIKTQQMHKQEKQTPIAAAYQIDKECKALNEMIGKLIIEFFYNSQCVTFFRVATTNPSKAEQYTRQIVEAVQKFTNEIKIDPLLVMPFIKFVPERIIEEKIRFIKTISNKPKLQDQVKIAQRQIELYVQGDMIRRLLPIEIANEWIEEFKAKAKEFLPPPPVTAALPSPLAAQVSPLSSSSANVEGSAQVATDGPISLEMPEERADPSAS